VGLLAEDGAAYSNKCEGPEEGRIVSGNKYEQNVSLKKGGKKFPVRAMKLCKGSGGIVPYILNLRARCRSVVSIILHALYPFQYEVGWVQTWSGRLG